MSVDPPEPSREVVESLGLPFRILADTGREVVRRYGLLHAGGGPDGSDIAVPAMFLLRPDGSVAWRHVARRIQDRADPAEVVEQVARL